MGKSSTTSTPPGNPQVMSTTTEDTKTTPRTQGCIQTQSLTQRESGTSHSYPHVHRDMGSHQALVRDHTHPCSSQVPAHPFHPWETMEELSLGPEGPLSPHHRHDCTHVHTHTPDPEPGRGTQGETNRACLPPCRAMSPHLPSWAPAQLTLGTDPPGPRMQPRIKGPFGGACGQSCQGMLLER